MRIGRPRQLYVGPKERKWSESKARRGGSTVDRGGVRKRASLKRFEEGKELV